MLSQVLINSTYLLNYVLFDLSNNSNGLLIVVTSIFDKFLKVYKKSRNQRQANGIQKLLRSQICVLYCNSSASEYQYGLFKTSTYYYITLVRMLATNL